MDYLAASKEVYVPSYGRYDITMSHGDGVYLYDVNGKKYLDFYAGIGVNSLGHNYRPYVEEMAAQMGQMMHISNYFNTVTGIEAAKVLCETIGMDKVFFANSGTEATEGALKLARKYYYAKHGVSDGEIIALKQSFHGRSTGSLRLTGNEKYQKAFGPLIEGVHHGEINNIASVRSFVNEKTAAIIVEPVQGEGGLKVCTKEFLEELRSLCDEKDIVLIFDEVQCGMGRTGDYMTYMLYDIKPDVVCIAKGIGAGFPVGAFAAVDKVAMAMEPGDHGSTYGGNPLAMRAVKTVFHILKTENMMAHVREVGAYFSAELEKLVAEFDCVLERRGLGLMQGLVLDHPVAPHIKEAQEKGLLFVGAGVNVIRLLPPFIIEKEDVDTCVSVIREIMADYKG